LKRKISAFYFEKSGGKGGFCFLSFPRLVPLQASAADQNQQQQQQQRIQNNNINQSISEPAIEAKPHSTTISTANEAAMIDKISKFC